MPKAPTIYLVPMPIGTEWTEVSEAAREVLRTVDTLLMEHEPRTVERMRRLDLLSAEREVLWMDGTELAVAQACIERGESLALVAATGIPGFVDPGWKVMDHWASHWWRTVDVVPVGMSSALDAALAMAGRDIRAFWFGGHFPEHHRPVRRPGHDPQVFYVRGGSLGTFVAQCRGWRLNFRRLLLFANVRKRGQARHWVIDVGRPLPEGLVDDPEMDLVAVLLGEPWYQNLYRRLVLRWGSRVGGATAPPAGFRD